ncbi:peroxisomal biogenesis factor 11 [Mrakia frigida]|uniref:Pex11p n=1 Tax=Mrakia frigida TaxID=29902 RepID=UPI003FCBFA33
MSQLALYSAHLLLHPQLTKALKVLSTTVGRDKTYRLIQYFSRIIAFHLLRSGRKQDALKFDGLKGGLGILRKGLRIGKPLEHVQSAVKLSAQGPKVGLSGGASGAAEVERLVQICRQVAYAGYLSTDMVLYLQSIKFLSLPPAKLTQTATISNRLWLSGIVLSVVSGMAGLVRVRKEAQRLALVVDEKAEGDRTKSKALSAQKTALNNQLLLDSLDFFIPANNLGYTHLSDGTVGAVG